MFRERRTAHIAGVFFDQRWEDVRAWCGVVGWGVIDPGTREGPGQHPRGLERVSPSPPGVSGLEEPQNRVIKLFRRKDPAIGRIRRGRGQTPPSKMNRAEKGGSGRAHPPSPGGGLADRKR